MRRQPWLYRGRLLLALLLGVVGCTTPPSPVAESLVEWEPVDSLNLRLPESVRVYSGLNESVPLAAWYVSVDLDAGNTSVHVRASDDVDRLETVSEFANDPGVCVAVNGGYYRIGEDPVSHVGLLMSDGQIVEPAIGSVLRDDIRYPTARATLGITAGGRVHLAWANSRNDSTIAWSRPPPNLPGQPAPFPDLSRANPWPVRDALSAGPRLLRDGAVEITSDAEAFFGSSIPEIHPRTAVGTTAEGSLILLVVDGRQRQSRGVDLPDLARILASTGATDGLNLDGGGSSALVVAGTLLNRPAGQRIEREVMSAVVVECIPER